MSISYVNQSKKYLSIATIASVIALSGCGGSSSKDDDSSSEETIDTSSLSEEKLRENMITGITQGVSSNFSALASVVANSKVLNEVSEQATSNDSQSDRSTRGSIEGNGFIMLDQGDVVAGISIDGLDDFSRMIDFSTIDQNKNVYSFNPNEAQVCSNPAGVSIEETSTAEEIANCQAFLSHITFVVTVTKMDNKEVTAATTVFKYDDTVFAKTGFSESSGYYEIMLPGMRSVLLGVNEISMDEDKITIPSVMQGSVKIDFTAPTETSGSFKVSIPSAVKLTSNTAGEEMQIDIAATTQLFSIAADSDNNTMEAVLNLNALTALMTETDESGNSFPVQLALSALTGKAAMTENGDKLKLVGLSADGVKLKIDNIDAMSLDLKPLDALIDSSGNKTLITLTKLLSFNLSQTNIRHFFESDAPTTDTLGISVDADNGTILTEYADDIMQVVTGNLSIKVTGVEDAFEVDASTGNCLNNSFDLIECPVKD